MSEISLFDETSIGIVERPEPQISLPRAVASAATTARNKSLIKLTSDLHRGNRREGWIWLILALSCAVLVVLSFLIPYL